MEATELKICRLCLKVVCKNEYEIVGEKLVMVKTIFMGLNWAISENPVMCCECFEELQNSYEFKSTCLTTEQHLKTASKGQEDEVDLWQITHDTDHGSREENKICRFCLKLNENSMCFNLEEKEDVPLMLQKCLPELDLLMVQEPVVCQNCFAALESLFNFVIECLSVEETINIYRDTKGSDSCNRVNLYDVLKFVKIKKESNGGDMCVEEFISASKFEEVFVKSEDVEGEELEIKSEVCVKNESLEYEVKDSVKPGDVELKAESEAPMRQKRQRKELKSSFSCTQCDFTTKYKRNMRLHIMVIHVKPKEHALNCNECSYQTFYPARLKAHVRLHTQDFPYACDICQEKYNHQRYLDSHIITKHPDSKQVIMTKVHKCNLCEFKTIYAMFLMKHVLSVHDNKDFRTFKCDKCVYSTDKRADLRRHVLTHSGTKPFMCPVCSKGFTTKTHVDSHILNRHSDKEDAVKLISSKIHYCKSCDYKSVNPTNLRSHIRSHHAHTKSFTCPDCSKGFMMKMYLDMHVLNRHSDKRDKKSNKPFVCPECLKGFVAKTRLDSHILNHHGENEDVMKLISCKIHCCNSCDYKAVFPTNLHSHVKNHHAEATKSNV